MILTTIRYFFNVANPQSTSYNETFLLRCRGSLDVSILSKAIGIVAERQPALRTLFRMNKESGTPFKFVQDTSSPDIVFKQAENESLEETLKPLVEANSSIPFDFENGPLFRVILVQSNFSNFYG